MKKLKKQLVETIVKYFDAMGFTTPDFDLGERIKYNQNHFDKLSVPDIIGLARGQYLLPVTANEKRPIIFPHPDNTTFSEGDVFLYAAIPYGIKGNSCILIYKSIDIESFDYSKSIVYHESRNGNIKERPLKSKDWRYIARYFLNEIK